MNLPENHADWPLICCLCPTYCRPVMLQTAVACWQYQKYPRNRILLLVVDDSPRDAIVNAKWFHGKVNCGFESFPGFTTLPTKYNFMAQRALSKWPGIDLFCVWEDDDVYLPDHCAAVAASWIADDRRPAWWAHPQKVYSDYSCQELPDGTLRGSPVIEGATGRFHASLALSRGAWQLRPWIETRAANFDQQYLGLLRTALGEPADPTVASGRPTYVFRWHTGHVHGQSAMKQPDDTGWIDRARLSLAARPNLRTEAQAFYPALDDRAKWLYDQLISPPGVAP